MQPPVRIFVTVLFGWSLFLQPAGAQSLSAAAQGGQGPTLDAAGAIGAFLLRHPKLVVTAGAGVIGEEVLKHPLLSAAVGALIIAGVAVYKNGKSYRKRLSNGMCVTASGKQIPTGTFALDRFDGPDSRTHSPHAGSHYHYYQAMMLPTGKCIWDSGYTTDAPIPGALEWAEPFI